MNRPRWSDPKDGQCQWPRCRKDIQTFFTKGATKWITHEDGVGLCDEHHGAMNSHLHPGIELDFAIGDQRWIKEFEDFPRTLVYIVDWFVLDDVLWVLVDEDPSTRPDECLEIRATALEPCLTKNDKSEESAND